LKTLWFIDQEVTIEKCNQVIWMNYYKQLNNW